MPNPTHLPPLRAALRAPAVLLPALLLPALLLPALLLPAAAPQAADVRPPAQSEQRMEAADPDYRAGVEALGARRIDEAERLFRAALARRPNNELAVIGLADVAWARGRREEAGEHLRRAVQLAPNSPRPAQALALWFAGMGQAEAATQAFRDLVVRFPDQPQFRADLGGFLLARGDGAGAETVLREAIARFPAAPEPRGVLVQGLIAQNRLDDARREAVALVAAAPTDARGPMLVGQIEGRRGDWRAALAAFERAGEVAPRYAGAHLARGELLFARGETALATAAFDRAIELDPVGLAQRLGRAAALERGGQIQPAERAYLDVLERDPGNFMALNNLAFLSAEHRRNLDRAEGWARRAAELVPQAMEPRSTLGWVLRARGDLPGAAREMEQASRMAENRAQIWVQLATIYIEQGRVPEARQAAERALAREPQNARAQELRRRAG